MYQLLIKSVAFLAFVSLSSYTLAESLPQDYYWVASNKHVDSIPKGKCLVTGRVTEAYAQVGVKGGIIANFTRSSYTTTNDSGYYSMLISAKDTGIFFYHPKYKEIVCWSFNFESQHVVEMNFVTSEKLPEGVIQVAEKPVIYLYSDEEKEVTVKLDNIQPTFTYPEYNDGWKVTTLKDGELKIGDKSFPYLFWEANIENVGLMVSDLGYGGFAINTDSTVQFLERTLDYLALNNKEATDFITYWAPRLMAHKFANIQFYIDESYDKLIGDVNIVPNPDARRRVYMVFEGSDYFIPSVRDGLYAKPFTREGLVYVEWGGTELNSQPKP